MVQRVGGLLIARDLRCDYLENPLGVGQDVPRLSWKLGLTAAGKGMRGVGQAGYQILVATKAAMLTGGKADLWDSGRVHSAASTFVEYGGRALGTGERAWWTVRVWDEKGGVSKNAAEGFWERGIVDQNEWQKNGARWVGSSIVGGQKTEVPSPFVRKEFVLARGKKIASARLYVTALGIYEFYLNGQRVGEDVFAPFWTDYRKRVQYQVYDVTKLVHAGGENVAGAILGDGWYCGYTGNIRRRQFYGDRPRLLAQIIITFTDGSTQIIATDGSWTTATGPILASDMFNGESYDARLEMPGWSSAGFAPGITWNPVTLFDSAPSSIPASPARSADAAPAIVAMTGPAVRAVKTLRPVAEPKKITKYWNTHVFIFDLGQNMVGRVRLKVKGPAGATVTLTFAEVLDKDGQIYTANLRHARQTDVYTLRGDPKGEIYESHFTFHGFRYVEVLGYPGNPTRDSLTGVVLHSDIAPTGTFECSEPLVNQLQRNIQWGQRGNFLDIPTDCPQRDERLGWTGDAQVFVRTAAFNFDVSGFFAKWTQDLRDAQGQLGGYPSYIPNNVIPRVENDIEHNADGGPAWADAGVICPWTMFLAYGDRRLIEQHYDSMVRFVERLRATSKPFGLIRAHPDWKGWHGFGDWLSQDGKDGLFGNTPKDIIGTAYLAYDARLLAELAAALGKKLDAAKYSALSAQAAGAFRRRFITPDGLVSGNTQTAYVLALHFDLMPEKLRPAAVAALVHNIRMNKNRLNTGFVGTPYLLHVLTAAGRLDVAYELLLQKNWPSWLYAVLNGATTIWERWDGWTKEKGFQDEGMNSFNHYAYGAVGDWLYQVVAGLDVDPARPGYEHVIFRPHPLAGGPLKYARAEIETIHGRVESGWRIGGDGRTLHYQVTVPPNVSATAYVPAAEGSPVKESGKAASKAAGVKVLRGEMGVAKFELGSGSYGFESTLPERPKN